MVIFQIPGFYKVAHHVVSSPELHQETQKVKDHLTQIGTLPGDGLLLVESLVNYASRLALDGFIEFQQDDIAFIHCTDMRNRRKEFFLYLREHASGIILLGKLNQTEIIGHLFTSGADINQKIPLFLFPLCTVTLSSRKDDLLFAYHLSVIEYNNNRVNERKIIELFT